jgi:hypothetical protein
LIVADWDGPGVDIKDGSWDPAWPTELSVEDTCFWDNHPNYPVDMNDDNGGGVFLSATATVSARVLSGQGLRVVWSSR